MNYGCFVALCIDCDAIVAVRDIPYFLFVHRRDNVNAHFEIFFTFVAIALSQSSFHAFEITLLLK